ncbi:hypothetical protein AVEN_38366-1 [Araneus ventricosus]|uniref:Uncharacterized protein n=1 Tax=Araneus ventricosus TaxID=182803 RepID=A0A4Y2J6P7_ARAVE|nr:hypothetical protein AVEN_38366-1 [Araneus ventricosus]
MLSSSRLMSDTFLQASLREQVHREEHIRPVSRQPQGFLHPFLQLQDIIFRRDSGAASLYILRGERPNRVCTQPHSRGFLSCPNHFCIWKSCCIHG